MSFSRWGAMAMLGALPLAAIGGQHAPADPVDARVPGAPFTYESAFKTYRATTEEQESPDKTWRAVNDTVGKLGGHSGHIGEGNNASDPATTPEPDTVSPMPMRPEHGMHHRETGWQQ